MITLTSDFGTPYPASMKGVVLQKSDARLVDIGHDFPRQDVRTAAFWLRETLPTFPPAVHLVVVDPGVGTDRRAIVVRAGDHAIVAPDNGVGLPAARTLADGARSDGSAELVCFEIGIEDPDSATFHGRDIFAPAAAAVHEAAFAESDGAIESLDCVAGRIDDPVDLSFPQPERTADGATGEILVVDEFGNSITNVPGDVLSGHDRIRVDGESIPVVRSYAHASPGDRVVTVGSHGNVELAVNRGRGDDAFGVEVGDRIELRYNS
ncbi:MAG: SAM-dependent chlorinase/fluorinase [Natronomonas sp.]